MSSDQDQHVGHCSCHSPRHAPASPELDLQFVILHQNDKKYIYEIYSQRGTKHVMSFFLEHVASKSSFKNTVGRASPILKVG